MKQERMLLLKPHEFKGFVFRTETQIQYLPSSCSQLKGVVAAYSKWVRKYIY